MVSDDEILKAQRLLASKEGIFVEPASAASLAGLMKLRDSREIGVDEITVLITTGHGLKDPNVVMSSIALPEPIDASKESLYDVLR